MSQQAIDLRRSIRIVRRHRLLVGIMAVLGLLGAGAYAASNPPLVTGTALVLLPQTGQAALNGGNATGNNAPNPYTATQELIAKSSPVLLGALPHVRPVVSITKLTSNCYRQPHFIYHFGGRKREDRCRCRDNGRCRRRELHQLRRLRKQPGRPGSGPVAPVGSQ